ncbi:MAG: hypothetical protein LBN92_02315 [Treponema sp.]|jgi:hypothetical protein|nr:hypothetical protein [Treponema sp.]
MRRAIPLILILGVTVVLAAQSGREVLRGEVRIDLEPAGAFSVEEPSPPDLAALRERAMAEAASWSGAMIYGWSFHYDIGERARGIAEELRLAPLGTILPGDPRIEITDFEVKETSVYLWSDYRPAPAQLQRMAQWRAGSTRSAQGYGYGPHGVMSPSDLEDGAAASENWLAVRKLALEDAARAALRAVLRGSERNRPKEASGYISLAAFPRFWLDSGRWAASARFLIAVETITPFAAY